MLAFGSSVVVELYEGVLENVDALLGIDFVVVNGCVFVSLDVVNVLDSESLVFWDNVVDDIFNEVDVWSVLVVKVCVEILLFVVESGNSVVDVVSFIIDVDIVIVVDGVLVLLLLLTSVVEDMFNWGDVVVNLTVIIALVVCSLSLVNEEPLEDVVSVIDVKWFSVVDDCVPGVLCDCVLDGGTSVLDVVGVNRVNFVDWLETNVDVVFIPSVDVVDVLCNKEDVVGGWDELCESTNVVEAFVGDGVIGILWFDIVDWDKSVWVVVIVLLPVCSTVDVVEWVVFVKRWGAVVVGAAVDDGYLGAEHVMLTMAPIVSVKNVKQYDESLPRGFDCMNSTVA